MPEMDGKVVIVTGGNSGIGRVATCELAKMGAEVIIASRSENTCVSAVNEIKSKTGNEKVRLTKP